MFFFVTCDFSAFQRSHLTKKITHTIENSLSDTQALHRSALKGRRPRSELEDVIIDRLGWEKACKPTSCGNSSRNRRRKIPCSRDTILHSGEGGLPFPSRAWQSTNAFMHNELCSSEIHPHALIGREAWPGHWRTVKKPASLSPPKKLHQPRRRQACQPWRSVHWRRFTGIADDEIPHERADPIR